MSRARWSLFIIFGVGGIGVVVAIVSVIRSAPEGSLEGGYGAKVPANEIPAAGRDVSKPARCMKFGDRCEFSPGKLGSCMERENCTGGNCLFCQSQH